VIEIEYLSTYSNSSILNLDVAGGLAGLTGGFPGATDGMAGSGGIVIVTPVPEPRALLAAGLALTGLALARRQQRRRGVEGVAGGLVT
jgi:hypothetical protein